MTSQDWVFQAASGERLELHIKYESGTGNRGNAAVTKFYSAQTPTMTQNSSQQQVMEIIRNPTTNPPDRVKEYTFKGSGGAFAKIFDGTERTVSWDNVIIMNRAIVP